MSVRSGRHGLEHLVFRALRAVAGRLRERVAVRCGALLGAFVGSVLRVRRRDVDRHLRQAFPDRARRWQNRIARASYRHLGREAVATFRRGAWSPELLRARTTMVGFEAFRAAAGEPEGVVLLTAHLGNWEIGGAAIAARGVRLDVVGKGTANRLFQEELFAAREELGMRVIEMSDAPREVLRSLARGGVTALLWDQNAHRNGVFVPFFGKPASTARGPALFALRASARVYFAAALREPSAEPTYRVTFERLPFEPSGDVEADVNALATAYSAALEEAIRAAPDQYFWQHRRWKSRPREEPPTVE